MTTPHECIHEEQILGQSRTIERLNAEMEYKKEKLDDLKDDNRRMEKKLDNLNESINNFITKSDAKDTKLDLRLTKIETKMDEQDKAIKAADEKRKEYEEKAKEPNQKFFTIMGVVISLGMFVLTALTVYFNFLR